MASRVNIVRVDILDNPAMFTDKFKLEITFEVFENLPHDLEWELVYVGSGTSRDFDQVLDSALVGPIPEGRHKFVFDADHPDIAKIPLDDVCLSVLLLRCKYNEQEFINMGWWVANEYTDDELKQNPPAQPIIEKLTRKVEIDDLRVTTFPIRWTDEEPVQQPEEPDRVFAEEDLMPLNDEDGQDEDDEDDEEDEDEMGDGEVDLNESFNERMAQALVAAGEEKEDDDEEEEVDEEKMEEDVGNNDVEMGDDEPQINNDKLIDASEPLSDKTNNAEMSQ